MPNFSHNLAMKKSLLAKGIVSFLMLTTAQVAFAADPWPANSSATELIPSSLASSNAGFEASGVEYLAGYGFIVNGDDGDVAVVDDSNTLAHYWFPTGDLEDITITDTTSTDHKVYLANEATNSIEEFNLTTGLKTGLAWTLSDLPVSGGSGFEALAFVPAAYAPAGWGTAVSGGFFIAASQAEANVRVYTFNRITSSTVTSLTQIPVSYTDVSALHYNTSTRLLYVVFDTDNKMKEYSLAGAIVNSYVLPTAGSEEGVVLIPNCNSGTAQIVIANDGTANSVSSYAHYPIQCDVDGDGVVYNSDCNDNDAAISANQTYYRDVDGDGLGTSTTTTSVCSLTAPTGYVTNNTDADDSGVITITPTTDPITTDPVSETPDYTTYDPLNESLYAATVSKITGVRHGKIKVHFSNGSSSTYSIFGTKLKRKTQLRSVRRTAYLLVTAQHRRRAALVNAYTGEIVDSIHTTMIPKKITVILATLTLRLKK